MLPDLSKYQKVTRLYKVYDARYDARLIQSRSRGDFRLETAQLEGVVLPL